MGLPTVEEDLSILFENNYGENTLYVGMKEKFNTFRGKRGLDVCSISDDVVRFLVKVLACKLLRKCQKDEVLIAIITAAKK
jgi:hypothetical protein